MKLFFSIFTMFALTLFNSCVKNTEVESEKCIDPNKINENAPCYLIYAPVCGCDEITYSNDCIAKNNGVLHYKEGACEDK